MPARIIAEIARKSGGKMLNQAIGKAVKETPGGARSTVVASILGALAVRTATRSVPGAILVGGGLLAKTLYDRRQAKRTAKAADKRSPKS